MSVLDKWIKNIDAVEIRVLGQGIDPSSFVKIPEEKILNYAYDEKLLDYINTDKALISLDGVGALNKADSLLELKKIADSANIRINIPTFSGEDLETLIAEARDTAPGQGGIFGQNYQEELSLGNTSRTSTSWYDKINKTFTGLAAGAKYKVEWYTEAKFRKSEKGLYTRIKLDNSIVTSPIFKLGEKQSNYWFPWSGYVTKVISGTDLKVELEFKSGQNGKSVALKNTRIAIWRVG